MYRAPESDGPSRGMKVKHLVQLGTLMVLFTWFLYQLNMSHHVQIANFRFDVEEIEDDGGALDDAWNFLNADSDPDQFQIGDEILSRAMLRGTGSRPGEVREIDREENNNGVDELDRIEDDGDDSGEGDGHEDAANLVDHEDHVPSVEEIEGEGQFRLREEAVPEAIVLEESDPLEQLGQPHSSNPVPASGRVWKWS